jgi:DNA polymerase V
MPVPIGRATSVVIRGAGAAGAGFPSPAQDWEEPAIDLATMLELDRPSAYVFRVSGDSMIDVGIHDQDVLVVDRDAEPCASCVVIAVCDGGFVVREIRHIGGLPHLVGRNAASPYKPRLCDPELGVEIWGVARTLVRHMRR